MERITRRELAEILERNTYLTAAAEIWDGKDPIEATAYMVGKSVEYDDGEGHWAADVPAALREGRLVVIETD